ncbi:MAG: site-specific DNA-methyltransferase [Chloroflexota bacterium]|nr:site-specific DNA-methyltransferase [Chloroflexota bacterium]
MIYVDPPYGIKFASNFQPEVGNRDVRDQAKDLAREPEVVRAYRDTWSLGIHTYLTYLRERLILARGLLADSGSLFVQMGEDNVHIARSVLDEVMGRDNFVSLISFRTTSVLGSNYLGRNSDYLIWYAKSVRSAKFRRLYKKRGIEDDIGGRYTRIELLDGTRRVMSSEERSSPELLPIGAQIYSHGDLTSQDATATGQFPVQFEGHVFRPVNRHWTTQEAGIARLAKARRLAAPTSNSLRYIRFLKDFPVGALPNVWSDTQTGAFTESKVYVVQTNTKVIERCLLMTTDPGDLVLDPTCGSGTTAYAAEQWGRRWITIDTSRVALAIARQRLLSATFDQFKLGDESAGPSGGFYYKTVPHITLKSIAQNSALDSVFARHEPILAGRLAALNVALAHVTPETRTALAAKLTAKERAEGKKAVTDADRRRWLLPKEKWEEWQVPFDADPDWPQPLQAALAAYRAAWRAKMDEVNAVIAASAEQEELVDQPEVVKGVVRVSGPFTVEAVLPAEERLDTDPSPIDEPDEDLDTFASNGNGAGGEGVPFVSNEPQNADAYLDKMIRLLRADGVTFLGNKQVRFDRLDPLRRDILHAEGEWLGEGGEPRRVAVTFGPQYGDVTAKQVEDGLWAARRDYDDVVFAGFSFDAAAQATIQDDPNPRVRAHLAQIRPDINPGMDGLLKQTPNSQLFTVMALPRTRLDQTPDGHWTVTMEGVDVYDPVTNELHSTRHDKIAAWFLDTDYDGRTFCITQAFFPDKTAWDKLARALKGVIDPDAFAAFSGTVSLPFPAGRHAKVAVKVIDPRGTEAMRVHALTDEATYR